MMNINNTVWCELKSISDQCSQVPILSLFEKDDTRASEYSVSALDMHFDYSKTSITAQARSFLISMAKDAQIETRRDDMFSGAKINETEGRAVLHTALRNLSGRPVLVDGADIMPDVLHTLTRMREFATAVRTGAFKGQGGKITDVVNIGIGGSDLGPAMAVLALAP